jgi:hypothetical protein
MASSIKKSFREEGEKLPSKAIRLNKSLEYIEKEKRNGPWNELEEDPEFTRVDWVFDVKHDETQKGYWDWVIYNLKNPGKSNKDLY